MPFHARIDDLSSVDVQALHERPYELLSDHVRASACPALQRWMRFEAASYFVSCRYRFAVSESHFAFDGFCPGW